MRFIRMLAFAGAMICTVSAASAQQVQRLRVGYIPVLGAAQIFVAEGEGWNREAGLQIVTSVFESGPNMIQALQSGTLDVYIAGFSPLVVAYSKGIDVRAVSATIVEEMALAASAHFAPVFDGRPAAQVFKEFREKNGRKAKLATQPLGSGPNTALQHWLWEVANVSKSDVELIEMGIDGTQRAIATGAVEGGSIREPALAIVTRQNPRIKVVATANEMFPNFPGVVMAVLGSFADKNPQAVDALIRNIARATKLLQENPEQAVKHISAAFGRGIVPDEFLLAALKSPQTKFVSDPRTIVESTRQLLDFQVKIGVLPKTVPLDGLFAIDVYDRALNAK